MKEKDQKFIKNWNIKRQNKWRYIFRFGVLGWGLPVGIIAYFLMVVIGSKDFEISRLVIQVLVFGGGGMAYGYSQFNASDKRYLQLIQSERQPSHEKP